MALYELLGRSVNIQSRCVDLIRYLNETLINCSIILHKKIVHRIIFFNK